MGKKEEVPNRQYTLEFKLEAVRLAQSIGGNQAAKRLGIPDSKNPEDTPCSNSGKFLGHTSGTTSIRRQLCT